MAITIELTPSEAREVAPLLRSLHSGDLHLHTTIRGDGPTLRAALDKLATACESAE